MNDHASRITSQAAAAPTRRSSGKRASFLFSLAVGMFMLWVGLGGCSLSSVTGGPGTAPTPTDTALPTQPPGPTATPDPVRADDIVYIRKYIYGLSGDLYLVHTDGLSPRQITSLTRDQASAASDFPVWSPDHKTLAFSSEYRDLYNKAIWNLYTTDTAGTGAQQITGLPQPNNGFFPTLSITETKPGISIWAIATPPPGGKVSGRVLADGKPVAGAVVVSWLGLGFAQTDADGRYTLDNVPAGIGWIKATSEDGEGWIDVTVALGETATAPDIALDPTLINAEYIQPGWDLDGGGLWNVYSRHWFDPATKNPRYEQRLVHVNLNGSEMREFYTARDVTLGRPRVRPNHADQVALVDGTDLLLLTIDQAASGDAAIKERRVLASRVQRSAPVSWSPDGETIYYTVESGDINVNLMTLPLSGGAATLLLTFEPNLRDQPGFDTSPDGTQFVYENKGDMYIFTPADGSKKHITFYGAGSRPTWSGR